MSNEPTKVSVEKESPVNYFFYMKEESHPQLVFMQVLYIGTECQFCGTGKPIDDPKVNSHNAEPGVQTWYIGGK